MTHDRNRWVKQLKIDRQKMTICIAAICQEEASNQGAILLCTDWLLSGDLGSAERMLKQRSMGKGFHFLGAGDEIEVLALNRLVGWHLRRMTQEHFTEDDVLVAVRTAIQARKFEKADEYTRGR